MDTPICDFVNDYLKKNELRLHMPGHKGKPFLGFEPLDITEIDGAGVLYADGGIIDRSEENASFLFGSGRTLYSTEGASLCIRAMLYLAVLSAARRGKKAKILAGRNAHKSFFSAAALLSVEVVFLEPGQDGPLYGVTEPSEAEKILEEAEGSFSALYVTSPDYLGNISDIGALSELCKKHDILLLVDNAHGAYLKFLTPSMHPLELGASLCADSAHKTLPVLTGGAYLHISKDTEAFSEREAKSAMALFASTSPSYLILQSLDLCNKYLSEGYVTELDKFTRELSALKTKLENSGFKLCGQEPLKLSLSTKSYGYTGLETARLLLEEGIRCEFCDPDFVCLMLTPQTGAEGLEKLERALLRIERREALSEERPSFGTRRRVLPLRELLFRETERLPVRAAKGKIAAEPCVSCPPAVPLLIGGEIIDAEAIRLSEYYGIEYVSVLKASP